MRTRRVRVPAELRYPELDRVRAETTWWKLTPALQSARILGRSPSSTSSRCASHGRTGRRRCTGGEDHTSKRTGFVEHVACGCGALRDDTGSDRMKASGATKTASALALRGVRTGRARRPRDSWNRLRGRRRDRVHHPRYALAPDGEDRGCGSAGSDLEDVLGGTRDAAVVMGSDSRRERARTVALRGTGMRPLPLPRRPARRRRYVEDRLQPCGLRVPVTLVSSPAQ